MEIEAVREKRPYLGREDRRRVLLDKAAEMVETQGWSILTMSALAEQAGVSRQLVYQHFPNLSSLLAATAMTVFMNTAQGTEKAIADNRNNLRQAIRAAAIVSLDLPRGRGDALWQLLSGTGLGSPELEFIRQGIRDTVLTLWEPMFSKLTNVEDATSARAMAWMLIMAFWGMRQMVRDSLITRDQGLDELDRLLGRVLPDSF
ncbi:MAG: TetR/AcrR family transcriptional regulator [Limnobacter sp.]|jgi:AcrR family transcriptional regulator|uniref:TetR/AcrR family transcriptional regulator n=1 Tax=Limnobacter sp. TaxID=2003368 RepID=UPI00391DE503